MATTVTHANGASATMLLAVVALFGVGCDPTGAGPAGDDQDNDGWTVAAGDCNDGNGAVNPDATDVVGDGVDQDCDGVDGFDGDGDGLAADWSGGDDCDDDDASIGEPPIWYVDADGDGFGADDGVEPACAQPAGTTAAGGDCDDDSAEINPAASETCDRSDTDEDCDGLADNADPGASGGNGTAFYVDADADGFGSKADPGTGYCDDPSEAGAAFSVDHTDCNDADASANPAATEVLDRVDNDCDGTTDNLVSASAAATLSVTEYGTLAGYSVSGAGDVDGDGFADIVVGAPGEDAEGAMTGAAYLLRGSASAIASGDLSADSSHFTGAAAGDSAGRAVAGVGDLNADGFDDIVIGAYGAGSPADSGVAYVLLGSASGIPSMSLALADYQLSGEAGGDHAGQAVGAAGDVNADGFDDVLIGAPAATVDGTGVGAVYLLMGSEAGLEHDNLSQASGRLVGDEANGSIGFAVRGAGDFDGDGFDDVILGAAGSHAFMFSGSPAGIETVGCDGADSEFIGEGSAGWAVAGLGDVNGDGRADIGVGAYSEASTGAAYVVFGTAAWTLDMALADADVRIAGESPDDQLGYSMAGAGDVDGDSFDDILIGAPLFSGAAWQGKAYLAFGSSSPPGNIDGGDVNASIGTGNSGDPIVLLGYAVAGAGDTNGDGKADILIGAPGQDPGGVALLFLGAAI